MLLEVGEEGQRKIEAASVEAQGQGLAGWVARRYLEGGGVREVRLREEANVGPDWVGDALQEGAGREVVAGAVEALKLLRKTLETP